MGKSVLVGLFIVAVLGFSACSSASPEGNDRVGTLPEWVTSLPTSKDSYRAVGFGQGDDIPLAVQTARRNALLQIIDSSFGESVRYRYQKEERRLGFSTTASVHDFFEAASSGNLFGQRVVHNAVRQVRGGYVAYVMVEVSKKDIGQAYKNFIEEERARRDLRLAETRGAVLLGTGHYRKALGFYRQKAKKDPQNDVWWIGIGAAQYRLGNYPAALKATDHGLLLNPRSFYGYWNRSSILQKLGRHVESVNAVRVACRIRPSEACSRRRKEAELNVLAH